MKRLELWIIGAIFLITGVITYAFHGQVFRRDEPGEENYEVTQTWEMPDELAEISGIAWIGSNKIAAIQDEDAIIYIYDLDSRQVIKKIPFGDHGDFEAIAVRGEDAYVMESDGKLFEILNYQSEDRQINTYDTPLTGKNNIESLALDRGKENLLIIPKDKDTKDEDHKAIYYFSIDEKEFKAKPYVNIDLKSKKLEEFEKKKSYKTLRPSEIAVHPGTGEVYLLEGVDPKLLILDLEGKIEKIYTFDDDVFPQPEGMTFTPMGDLFISNEGRGSSPGNILMVDLY
ncbi:MAG: hypothetical protein CL868_03705 [Cytophagaceae bacterium]|nr:hypothetical protein [Cytophagaceae bacterium]|tara:strand:- start:142 stop:999 length:858 start_codon:yes stop_codon:yes gene_type:complete